MSNEAWANLAFFLFFFVIAYLLFIRPARKRAQAASVLQSSLSVGDDIMLTSGMFGRIVAIGDDAVSVDVATGVVVRVHRGAVGKIVNDRPATTTSPTADVNPSSPEPGDETRGVR